MRDMDSLASELMGSSLNMNGRSTSDIKEEVEFPQTCHDSDQSFPSWEKLKNQEWENELRFEEGCGAQDGFLITFTNPQLPAVLKEALSWSGNYRFKRKSEPHLP